MAEIKNFWICHDPVKVDGSYDHLFEDPAITSEEVRIAQLGPDSEGMSIHRLVRVYVGTGQDTWEREKTKVYEDFASAKADAEKRIAKLRKQYDKKKQASVDPLVNRVVAKFARNP